MTAVPTLLDTRNHLVELHQALSAQRAGWWSSGKFSLPTLAEVQQLIETLPNLRDESLAALARLGKPSRIDESAHLNLAGIGWVSARVGEMDEVRRIQAVEQAIARLNESRDADLLASALALARSLCNDKREWTEKLAPIAEWAAAHTDEIEAEAAV